VSLRPLLIHVVAAGALGCAAGGPDTPAPAARQVATPATLAVRSADDFRDNRAGVVTNEIVERWFADWATNRPAGITGELVVLQPDEAPGALKYLSSPAGVRAYHAPDLPLLLQPRNNGVVAIGRVPGNGVRADSYLRRYGIRADRDLVLLVVGTSSVASMSELARAWLTLRYWGLEHRSLAILNGSVAELPESLRVETSPPPPIANGDVRVSGLLRNYFAVVAHLGDVREAALEQAPLLDTRALEEFDGASTGPSSFDDTCLAGAPNCTATFSGRIGGARHFPLSLVFDEAAGRFRPLADVDTAARRLAGGPTPILYDGDGTRSALATVALLGVSGTPVRWYAASFLEWGALNATHPVSGLQSLPASSPWRTDAPALTAALGGWASTEHGIRPLVFDPAAPSANRVLQDDLGYLEAPAPLPAPGIGDGSCLRD
jgi:thiosulfate/3-mercaptopyruvate sulfurtransferase